MYVCVYIYIYTCVCVCVCVCIHTDTYPQSLQHYMNVKWQGVQTAYLSPRANESYWKAAYTVLIRMLCLHKLASFWRHGGEIGCKGRIWISTKVHVTLPRIKDTDSDTHTHTHTHTCFSYSFYKNDAFQGTSYSHMRDLLYCLLWQVSLFKTWREKPCPARVETDKLKENKSILSCSVRRENWLWNEDYFEAKTFFKSVAISDRGSFKKKGTRQPLYNPGWYGEFRLRWDRFLKPPSTLQPHCDWLQLSPAA